MAVFGLILVTVLATPQTVSFDLKDIDLRDFFAAMGESRNLNVVLHPGVEGKITLKVREAQWDVLLDMVLKNYNLGREIEGNVMRIAPLSALDHEYRQRAALEEARLNALPLETRTYVLNYARAADLAVTISKFLSPRGVVVADTRRNLLIVRDVIP